MQVGKLQKRQTRFNRALQQLALVIVHGVPFVDSQNHRTATFQDVASNMGILIGHPLGGIEQQQHDVGRLNGLQGFDHRELFNGLKHTPFATQACGVDEFKFLPLALKRHADGIARGTGHIKRHQALFTQPGVDKRGFAHIGAPRHCQFDRPQAIGQGFILLGLRQVQRLQSCFYQPPNALTMGCRHGVHLAQTQLIKL